MKTLFADTGYWIAVLNSDDALHQTAINVTTSLVSFQVITTEMVFTFISNALTNRGVLPTVLHFGLCSNERSWKL
jgi:predicted nucleic acid-binding protein